MKFVDFIKNLKSKISKDRQAEVRLNRRKKEV